jgi:DNA (cytosine-5)-methyltransferase 1
VTDAPTTDFTFIDLFAGIGGIRRAFQDIGGKCVMTSEWNKFAKLTYELNYAKYDVEGHMFHDDITTMQEQDVPEHDVLLAGFPCQPFSIAGVSKKNALGRKHGFEDPTQGTLFFDIKRIINERRPAAFLLENVKNLKSHDRGRTFEVIQTVLEDELGYQVKTVVVNGKRWTPQHRERILIVGFREPNDFDIGSFERGLPEPSKTIDDILHRKGEEMNPLDAGRYFDHRTGRVLDKYTLTEHLWNYLQVYADKHRSAGNGFGFGLVKPGMTTRTLSARYYKDGSEILIEQLGTRPRRLTPRECARLMGFGEDFAIPVSDTQAYKQFGNSVVVPAIHAMAQHMQPYILQAVAQESDDAA